MKYFTAILLLLCITATVSAQNDCPEALIICGNNGFNGLTATGRGVEEVLGTNDCNSREHHTIWLELKIKTGGTLGFVLTPESDELVVDYDFFMYGPDVQCDSIGRTVRCSTTNPLMAGSDSNVTGMNDTEMDVAEGPGPDGNNFINWIVVQDDETYLLVIDRPVGESNFSIQWTGTARFHDIPEFLNPNNISINLERCDPEQDGVEAFNLMTHAAMFIGSQTDVVLTFHESANDAMVNLSPITTNLTSYQNTGNPQTIYMRMTNTVTGCFNVEQFDLITHPQPHFLNPQAISLNLRACDTDGTEDDRMDFDLTQHQAMLVDWQDVTVTYYTSILAANNGAGWISNPSQYRNTANPQTVFIRMESNTLPGCVTIASFQLFVNNPPKFNNPQNISLALQACGVDAAGQSAVFNLTQHTALLTNSQPQLQITYHENSSDAATGDNEITVPELYESNGPLQTIYMRLKNNATGCTATGQFNIVALPWPVFENPGTISLDLEQCDNDGVDDASTLFDLTQHETMLKGTQTNTVITWHTSQEDANNNTDKIQTPESYANTANPQMVYMRISNTLTGCFDTKSFALRITDKPLYHNPQSVSIDIEKCDTDGNDDGVFIFDLTQHANMLKGSNPNVTLTWYDDFNNAVAGTGEIINPAGYSNTANPQIIIMRLTDSATGCINLKTFEIRVHSLPVFANTAPVVIEECDLYSSGRYAFFNLTQEEAQLKGTQQNMAISYHENLNDASAGSNAITNPTSYRNLSNPQTIYVRMENTVTGCSSTTSLEIFVNELPQFLNPQDISIILAECDTDGNDDGFTAFNLTTHAAMLTGSQANVAITYYTSLPDALSGSSAITNTTSYTNLSNPQDIYMRMENTVTGCFNNAMFSLHVNSIPYFNNPQNESLKLEECDADAVDDKSYVFDLTTHQDMLTRNQPYTSIRYFESPTDAADDSNAITNPQSYRNSVNPQTIYMRIEDSETGCYNTGSFEIEVVEILNAGNPDNLDLCDFNGNGIGVFNLAHNDAALKNGNNATYVRYYRSQQNAEDEVNPMPLFYQNRAAYQPETIWARLENAGGCFGHDVKPFTITVVPMPEFTFTVKIADFTDHDNTLTVVMDGIEQYEFSLDGITYTDNPVFGRLDPGLYKLYVRHKNQCKTIAKDVVVLQYPKFFTPNGDGVNENWTVPYLYIQPKANVTIFDRYGKLITNFKGGAKGWDGLYNGSALPATDYWFVLELEDGRIIKGHFAMLR